MDRTFFVFLLIFFAANSLNAAEPAKTFYSNGKLKQEVAVLNDTDTLIKSYSEDGALASEQLTKNNGQEGTAKKYFKSGKLQSEKQFRGNKFVSVKEYFENGSVKKEQDETGTRIFNKGGRLVHEEVMKDKILYTKDYGRGGFAAGEGAETGATTKAYYQDGELIRKLVFQGNQLVRVKEYEDGDLILNKTLPEIEGEEEAYKAGKKNGLFRKYHETGEVEDLTYQSGKVTSKSSWKPE